jgi:hypothetical protein
MSQIRTTISANISEADRIKEISHIKRENTNILANLSTLEGEERAVVRSKSEQMKHLAKNYERLAELGEYQEPISHICATISRICSEKGLYGSAQLARAVLDEKYRQTEFTRHDYQNQNQQPETLPNPTVDNSFIDTAVPKVDNGNGQATHVGEDNSYYNINYSIADNIAIPGQAGFVDPLSHTIVTIDKPPEEMTVDELRQVTEARIARTRKSRETLLEDRRREKELIAECDKRKVALSPEFEQPSDEHIRAISPDSGPSEAWYVALDLWKSYGKLCDKLHRWRPPEDIQQELVDAFKADIEFLQPFIDEKYRQATPQWWVTQVKNLWHGKHGAAVMSAVGIDEKTIRKLTREQVGDRSQIDLARAIRFAAAIPKWASLWKWFMRMNQIGIAKRAYDLGPELSDRAFS